MNPSRPGAAPGTPLFPGGPARRARTAVLFGALGVCLVAGAVISLGLGAVAMAPQTVLRIVLHHVGLGGADGFTVQQDAVVWSIRAPRVLLAAVVGAGLGAAGAALQGVFRNPLADPQLVGVASGAAFGATAAVAAAGGWLGAWAGPLGGFLGGMAAGAVVHSLARHQGRTEVVTMVLAGIAVAALGLAGAALLGFAVDRPELRSPAFWSLGSISVATWRLLAVTARWCWQQ